MDNNSNHGHVDVNESAADNVCLADHGLFDSWRYIFNELITRNRCLNEKIAQLEKQFDRRLNEQNHQLSATQGQISELQSENKQLKQQLDLLQKHSEQLTTTSCMRQSHDRSTSNGEISLDRNQFLEEVIDSNALFGSLAPQSNSEIVNDDYQHQPKTFFGYLKDKMNYMLGESSGSDAELDDNWLTTDIERESNNLSKVIEKTERTGHRQSLLLRGDNDQLIAKIESDAQQPTMDLSLQRVTDEGLKTIVRALKANQQCETLRLNNNSITSVGASLLADMLNENNALLHLSLFHNAIADDGVRSLARALSTGNNTLVELHLGDNQITDQGALDLAQMLKRNRSLLCLNLQRNNIRDEGVRALAEAIEKHNVTIEALFLDSNSSLTDLTVDFLLQMVRNHRSLKTLSVAKCNLSSNGKERLCKVQQCKENLQVIV